MAALSSYLRTRCAVIARGLPTHASAAASVGAQRAAAVHRLRPLPGRRLSMGTATPSTATDEVERKFRVTDEVIAAVSALSPTPAAVLEMTDTYYDDDGYSLTTRDIWLRRRNRGYELKCPQAAAGNAAPNGAAPGLSGIDFYRELTSWTGIADELGRVGLAVARPLPVEGDASPAAAAWLGSCGLRPFATIRTQRRRYSLVVRGPAGGAGHGVNVDIDRVRFEQGESTAAAGTSLRQRAPEWDYVIGEVELTQPANGASAATALTEVFAALKIGREAVRGKVLQYIAQHRPAHYAALGRSGLLAAKLQ